MYDSDPEQKKFHRHIHRAVHIIFLITFGVVLFAIVITSTTLITSLFAAEAIKPYFRYSDKLLHFWAYFGISTLALGAFPKTRLVFIFLGLSSAGLGIELLQGNMGLGRTASLSDIGANCLGCAAPILIWITFRFLMPSKQV